MVANLFVTDINRAYLNFGIKENSLIGVAFSGGPDSVALLKATIETGRKAIAIHCNFHLRGTESDRDEKIARSVAQRLGVPIFVKHFDVSHHMSKTGESVEMACRTLRYQWFEELYDNSQSSSHPISAIALGHHLQDNVETILLNLHRTTGLRGMCGIPQSRDIFIRPMLGISKAEIHDYLSQKHLNRNGVDYATDSTNSGVDFKRNRVRNMLLPAAEEALPGFTQAIARSINNFKADSELLEALLKQRTREVVGPNGTIYLDRLTPGTTAENELWHILNILHPGKFSSSQCREIITSTSGAHFIASNIEYIKDRNMLVRLSSPHNYIELNLQNLTDAIEFNFDNWQFRAEIVGRDQLHLSRNNNIAWFDFTEMKSLTLSIESWRPGESMRPFGMKGTRLLSDIFNDAKIGIAGRQMWPVVKATTTNENSPTKTTNNHKILWLPGLRTSREFTIKPDTETILKLTAYKLHN